jgi:hypothetical protein
MSYMNRAVGMAEVLWQLQDLRERTALAEAEQIKVERLIREVVRHLPNRLGRYGGSPPPLYTDPDNAVNALRQMMGRVAWLIKPGTKVRVRPEALLERWDRAANEAAILRSRYDDLRLELASAGISV